MGGMESKSQGTSHLNDNPTDNSKHKTTEDDANHTPLSNRRLVKLRDPRSPTDDVTRTPIIVPKPGISTDDSFEDPRSPTIKIARTPIPDTDPRSPTEGVTRTPCPFTYPDPRSPTINVARTPMLINTETETGKFEMPPVDQKDRIDDVHGEKQNVSTNNSNSDMARLIEQSQSTEEPKPVPLPSQKPSTENGLIQIDTPEYEMELSKMVEEQRLTEETQDDNQSLIAPTKGPSKKSKKASLKNSLTAKIHGSHSAPPRSPLSTRNLEKDAPSVHLHSNNSVITYEKAGSRHRQVSGTPTRLVGKYEPIIDKENF